MAQIPYRANLSAATFPLSLAKAGRTVINPGLDNTYDRRVDASDVSDKDAGIPQVIYMENVFPTYNGYQSIGFNGIGSEFNLLIPAGEAIYKTIDIAVPSSTPNVLNTYTLALYTDDTLRYNTGLIPTGGADSGLILGFGNHDNTDSAQFVQGRSFFFSPVTGMFELNEVLGALIFTDVTGTVTTSLTFTSIAGFCTAFNYHIAVEYDGTVHWSSLLNPLDWTPSLVTGAGSEKISQFTSTFKAVVSHPQGFIIYTEDKAIAAKYTGNRAYPWRFYEIESSGGIRSPADVVGGTNSSLHIIRSSSGNIQLVSMDQAEIIIPDVSDYLQNSKVYTYFQANEFITTQFGSNAFVATVGLSSHVTMLLDRYVFISYGGNNSFSSAPPRSVQIFDFAFVYDRVLRRLGRINYPHTEFRENRGAMYIVSGFSTTFDARGNACNELNTNICDVTSTHLGVLLVGKFEHIRNHMITLEEIDIESIQPQSILDPGPTALNFSLKLYTTLDGKNFLAATTPTLRQHTEFLIQYFSHKTGKNHSIACLGAFDISSLQLIFQDAGRS